MISNPGVDSALEVAFTLLVSNLAILFAVFIYMLMHQPEKSFWEVLMTVIKDKIKPTEIIVFILGFIAPAMWIMFKNIHFWRHTALWFIFLGVQAFVVISTAIIFAMAITETLMNTELAQYWANWCLLAALVVWYATLVYQKKVIEDPGNRLKTPRPGKESGSDVLAALKAN